MDQPLGNGKLGLVILAIALLLPIIVMLTEPEVSGQFGLPLDDGWIHLVFARNLANGNGFCFNPGMPINGATSFLWPILESVFFHLSPLPLVWIKLFGIILHYLTLLTIYHLVRLLGSSREKAFTSVLVYAFMPVILYSSIACMEVSLYVLLSTLGLYMYHLYRIHRGYWLLVGATFVFYLAGLSRPECFMLFFIILAELFIFMVFEARRGLLAYLKEISLPVAIFISLVCLYLYVNYTIGGQIFPNTFQAKLPVNGMVYALQQGDTGELLRCLTIYPFKSWLLFIIMVLSISSHAGLLFFIPGIIAMLRHPLKRIVPFLFILYPLAYGAFTGAFWFFHYGRYIQNLMPLLAILTVEGIYFLFQAGLESRLIQRLVARIALVIGIATAFGSVIVGISIVKSSYIYMRLSLLKPLIQPKYFLFSGLILAAIAIIFALVIKNTKHTNLSTNRNLVIGLGIIISLSFTIHCSRYYLQAVKNINQMQVHLGKWLAENTEDDARLAVNDIGAIGFFSHRTVYDLMSLINPEMMEFRLLMGRFKGDLEFLYYCKPDYAVLFPSWFPNLAFNEILFKPIYQVQLEDNLICGGDVMVVYRTRWNE